MVIASFSEDYELEIARCINAGADDLLSSDILETILVSRIRATLERRHLREQEQRHLAEIESQKALLEARNAELQAMNELKNRFIGMAAHDLRNPLVAIRGFSGMLLDDPDLLAEAERRQLTQIIHASGQRMLNLVNDLLDVSVIESGRLELRLQPGALRALVEERAGVYESSAAKKDIRLELDLRDPPPFAFDADRIAQVLDNLITNALKFSPRGQRVLVRLDFDDATAFVSVEDEGPGISAEDQRDMFRHFQKLGARPTGGESTTGLGLAIAKRMVDAHDGELTVRSAPGSGARFTFSLPRRPAP
jgi:signal transduction histidine kinase